MRGPHATPLSGCTPGEPCGCGLTVPVHRHEYQVVRQHLPWQSTVWFDSYGRRVGIESLNASIRGHRANINRGYIRVVGLAPVTTLLAFGLAPVTTLLVFGLAGMNTRILNAWYTSRGLPEPWATFLAEPSDERVPQREHRRYRPKRARGAPYRACRTKDQINRYSDSPVCPAVYLNREERPARTMAEIAAIATSLRTCRPNAGNSAVARGIDFGERNA